MKVNTGAASTLRDWSDIRMGDLVTINTRSTGELYVVAGLYGKFDVRLISLKDGMPDSVWALALTLFEGTVEISNDL